MLPCEVFGTAKVANGISIAATLLLVLGVCAQVAKRFMVRLVNLFEKCHADLRRLFIATMILSSLAALGSLIIFIWNISSLSHQVSIWNTLYFFFLTVFLFTILLPPKLLACFDKNNTNAFIFFCDYYLLVLYISIYLQINFLEANETLDIYDVKSNCTVSPAVNTTSFYSNTAHHDHHLPYLYEIIRAAVYAITVEVMVLLYVCHLEQKRNHKDHSTEEYQQEARKTLHHTDGSVAVEIPESLAPGSSATVDEIQDANRLTEVDVDKRLLDGNPDSNSPSTSQNIDNQGTDEQQEQKQTSEKQKHLDENYLHNVTKWDIIAFIFGLACVLVTMSALIAYHIEGQVGIDAVQVKSIVTWKTAFFGSMTLYVIVLFIDMRPCSIIKDWSNVSSTIDIQLLRWSTYGMLLLVLLFLAGAICGPQTPVTDLRYVQFFFNVTQVWTQYSFIYQMMALNKHLKDSGDAGEQQQLEGWKRKLRYHVIPLFVANCLYWAYNLWQWKTVAMLAIPKGANISPGPVWAVTEAILFPVGIFYRFHSAFLCCILVRVPAPKWLERVFPFQ